MLNKSGLVKSGGGHKKTRPRKGPCFAASIIALLILASGLALLAALDAGALIVLLLAEVGQHAGLGAGALEAL